MKCHLVSVIIPQYGREELTRGCVGTLLATHRPGDGEGERDFEIEVIVVDDGSWWSVEEGAAYCPAGVTVVRQAHAGVSAAWNHGARVARGEVLVFLNNDVLSLAPWVGELVQPLVLGEGGEDTGTASGTRRGKEWTSAVGRVLMTGCQWREEQGLTPAQLARLPSSRFLEGWCWGMRRETFSKLGGVDERMRLYWSDTDLQVRLLRGARGEAEEFLEAVGADGTCLAADAHPHPSASVSLRTWGAGRHLLPQGRRDKEGDSRREKGRRQRDPRVVVEGLPLVHRGHGTTRGLEGRREAWVRDRGVFVKTSGLGIRDSGLGRVGSHES